MLSDLGDVVWKHDEFGSMQLSTQEFEMRQKLSRLAIVHSGEKGWGRKSLGVDIMSSVQENTAW